MQHELKCVTEPFQAKWEGKKNWEFRKDDRNYKLGDTLLEREYDPINHSYSGREILEQVIWILPGGSYGVPEGFVIMSTKELSRLNV